MVCIRHAFAVIACCVLCKSLRANYVHAKSQLVMTSAPAKQPKPHVLIRMHVSCTICKVAAME